MRNVWGVPGTGRLKSWASESGFSDLRLVDVSVTALQEQRSTEWMRFESLEQALDNDDHRLTREGYPAPTRAVLLGSV
jgi:tRNA (mo5U34)-methyltransferase